MNVSRPFHLQDLHRDTTLGVIKAQLEELAQVPSACLELCASPTAAALGADDRSDGNIILLFRYTDEHNITHSIHR